MIESLSEKRGLSLLNDKHLDILSIGISTNLNAEIKMAKSNPNRNIIATTIDIEGFKNLKGIISKEKLSKQIEVKLENICDKMIYENNKFDFIYARLVLHYLNKFELDNVLIEIKRVLKKGGLFFIVLRKLEDWFKEDKIIFYDPKTRITTLTKEGYVHKRYFHNEKTIKEHLEKAGFYIISIKSYSENLSPQFKREIINKNSTEVIEIVAKF